MAHCIETRNGKAAMMYVGQAPWHGLGQRLDSPPTVADGIKAAGLDWTVGLEQLQTADGRKVDAFATMRQDDRKVLGVVGPKYHTLQNVDAFRFFDPFLTAGVATLHTAGSLDGGRRVWVLAHVSGSKVDIVPGDRVDSFILLSNSHDGTLAVRVGWTPIRVVCSNTLAMAHGDRASKLIRVRHTASMADNLAAIRDVMNVAKSEFEATIEQYRRLASKHINQNDVRRYVREVFEVKEGTPADDISTRMRNIMADVLRLTETGAGNDLPNVRGTMWAVYNGLTDYLSHHRGSDRENRLGSLWFGDSANLNKRALEIALGMAL